MLLLLSPVAFSATVSTLAGSGSMGTTDGTGTSAVLRSPISCVLTPDGSKLIFTQMQSVRQMVVSSTAVSTLAGSSSGENGYLDATGTSARFHYPQGVAITSNGATIYVADDGNNRIRQLVLSSTEVTTLAGSGAAGSSDAVGQEATFNRPQGVTLSPDDTKLFVADYSNHAIRQIVVSTRAVTMLAGAGSAGYAEGTGSSASFNYPVGLAMINAATLYVADSDNHRIREIAVGTGAVTTLAGSGTASYADGTGSSASFNRPWYMCLSPDGSTMYLSEPGNDRLRQITISSGAVSTLAGDGTAAYQECARHAPHERTGIRSRVCAPPSLTQPSPPIASRGATAALPPPLGSITRRASQSPLTEATSSSQTLPTIAFVC